MYYDLSYEQLNKIIDKKIKGSFIYMSIALFLTIISAIFIIMDNTRLLMVYNNFYAIAGIQLVVSLAFVGFSYRGSANVLKALLFIYSILTGCFLSGVLIVFDMASVITVLMSTFLLFTVLAIYGYTTKNNLYSFRGFLTVGLITLIIMSIVNIFFMNSLFEWLISVLGIVIFIIYTAYDTQVIKHNIIALANEGNLDTLDRVEIIGAFSLYLDFINLFISLLRIFGKKNN